MINAHHTDNTINGFIKAVIVWIDAYCYPNGIIVPSELDGIAAAFFPDETRVDRADRVTYALRYLERICYVYPAEGAGRWFRRPMYHEGETYETVRIAEDN